MGAQLFRCYSDFEQCVRMSRSIEHSSLGRQHTFSANSQGGVVPCSSMSVHSFCYTPTKKSTGTLLIIIILQYVDQCPTRRTVHKTHHMVSMYFGSLMDE